MAHGVDGAGAGVEGGVDEFEDMGGEDGILFNDGAEFAVEDIFFGEGGQEFAESRGEGWELIHCAKGSLAKVRLGQG